MHHINCSDLKIIFLFNIFLLLLKFVRILFLDWNINKLPQRSNLKNDELAASLFHQQEFENNKKMFNFKLLSYYNEIYSTIQSEFF